MASATRKPEMLVGCGQGSGPAEAMTHAGESFLFLESPKEGLIFPIFVVLQSSQLIQYVFQIDERIDIISCNCIEPMLYCL